MVVARSLVIHDMLRIGCVLDGLDLMADGAHRVRSSGVEKSGVVAVH